MSKESLHTLHRQTRDDDEGEVESRHFESSWLRISSHGCENRLSVLFVGAEFWLLGFMHTLLAAVGLAVSQIAALTSLLTLQS